MLAEPVAGRATGPRNVDASGRALHDAFQPFSIVVHPSG
jgi:hypothetical protein